MAERSVELLVVGAGPAGSAAALAAARRGVEVLVIERRKRIGWPRRCGEYAPRALAHEVPQGTIAPIQAVPHLALHLPSGRVRELDSPGVVLDRSALDTALANAAREAGATVWTETPLLALGRRGEARLGGVRAGEVVRARLVIGADGPRSVVAEAARLGRPRVMLGLQREVSLAAATDRAHLFFWRQCRHGYGWLFPKRDRANLGVALPRGEGKAARSALAALTRRLVAGGLLPKEELARGGEGDPGRSGLVPASGPLPRLAAGRVLLAGDAAGQTDALTGAGIVAAYRGGSLAGEVAADALRGADPRAAASTYEAEWRRRYGRQAARSLERRFSLEALWERDTERAVSQAWLGDTSKP